MKVVRPFPSIEQFRTAIYQVGLLATQTGLDETGAPIYNSSLSKPTLSFHGTVKLHGMNMGVSFNSVLGMWAQSRESLLTNTEDLAGFSKFVSANEADFMFLFKQFELDSTFTLTDPNVTITIFGEWAGQGIQSGVAISQLPKSFYLFGVNFSIGDEEPVWLAINRIICPAGRRIYSIEDYPTWDLDINFNSPEDVLPKLTQLTLEVEKECPVAKHFGVVGTGEGIVWSSTYRGSQIKFKTKGEKHAVVATKEVIAIAPEVLAGIKSFVDYAVTKNRLQQAITIVFAGASLSMQKFGDILKWMSTDIQKEEQDTLASNNLTWEQVSKKVSEKVKALFLQELKK